MKNILRFLREDDGPTAVEYAVMLALIILVCFIAVQSLGTQTATSFSNSSLSIGDAMSAS
jgi:pilus assembly protein Flp/PilA